MNVQPEKWEKYSVLFKYGLTSENEINTQIRRYSKQRKNKIVADIIDDMKQNRSDAAYVVKLIPRELRPKLTNYVIQDQSQLYATLDAISKIDTYVEVWWCKTVMSSGSGIHGRFYINSGGATEVSQRIEQVWANTTRKIESIGDGVPYLFAQRLWWGRRYHIQKSDLSQLNAVSAETQFYNVAKQLEEKRDQLDEFSQDASRCGIYSICIEYKLINGKLFVVDWDSPNDKAIMRRLL